MEEALVSIIEKLIQSQWNKQSSSSSFSLRNDDDDEEEEEEEDDLEDVEAKLSNILHEDSGQQMTLLHLAASVGYTR